MEPPHLIKSNYAKSTANIILDVQSLNAYPVRLGTKQECLISPLLFKIILEVLVSTIDKKRKIKIMPFGKKENFLCFLMTLSILKIPKKTLLRRNSEFSKVTGYKINTQNQCHVYILTVNN